MKLALIFFIYHLDAIFSIKNVHLEETCCVNVKQL